LLGDRSVQRVVEAFLAGGIPSDQDLDDLAGGSQRDLRGAAQLIAAAAAAAARWASAGCTWWLETRWEARDTMAERIAAGPPRCRRCQRCRS